VFPLPQWKNAAVLVLRIGIQLASLRLPLKIAIRRAAELGAEAVEIDARGEVKPRDLSQTGLRHLRKMLDDYNLRVCAVGFRTRRGYNVQEDLDQRVQATKDALDFAYKLGAQAVVNHVGKVPGDREGPEWGLLLETLSDLGSYGARVGSTLAARTGAESGEDLSALIAALPSGSIGVDFDPGNLIVNGFSVPEAAVALGHDVLHVHAKDGVRDLAQGRGLETRLGEGAVDFPELLGILEDGGYRGYFTVERQTAGDPLPDIKQAIQYLRSL
jgi:sugar phosphate isomerase/epimerase